MIRDGQRLRKAANEADPKSFGLLESAFLVQNPKTCFSFSVWAGEPAFSAYVDGHVPVARRSMGKLAFDEVHGPELWSTTWQLVGVSNNLHWNGFDLRGMLVGPAS